MMITVSGVRTVRSWSTAAEEDDQLRWIEEDLQLEFNILFLLSRDSIELRVQSM